MTDLPTYASVLVPTDASERAAHALPHACALLAKGGTIHLVRVLEQPEPPNPMYAHYGRDTWSPEEKERHVREAQAAMQALAAACPTPKGARLECHVLSTLGSQVVRRLCQAADELGADLVCLASHGRRGLRRALLGSVAEGVLRRCRVPTLVVRVPESELVGE